MSLALYKSNVLLFSSKVDTKIQLDQVPQLLHRAFYPILHVSIYCVLLGVKVLIDIKKIILNYDKAGNKRTGGAIAGNGHGCKGKWRGYCISYKINHADEPTLRKPHERKPIKHFNLPN